MTARTFGAVLALLAATEAVAQARAPEPEPRDIVPAAALSSGAPMATLVSGDLRVTLALPEAQRGFYRSTRFDWSGMITSVQRGRSEFYGPWFDGVAANVHDFVDNAQGVFVGPRNSGTGPAEEFANRDGETVPGYNAAAPGDTFLKIGVGHLRKDDAKPYDHFNAYAIADGGRWTVRRSASRVVFTHRLAANASGYGYIYEKTVSVAPGGVMIIAHRLRNTGSRPIRSQVYNHNLAGFDGAEIGSGVTVEFPFAPAGPVSRPALATLNGNTVRYIQPLAAGDRVQLPQHLGDRATVPGPFRVTGANGASITFQSDTPLVRTVLWSMRRTVAVEPFVAIDVKPGGEQRWSWRYVYTGAR